MRYFALAALIPVAASAVNIPVSVGQNGQLAFSPTNVTAAVGDVLNFSFFPSNHSVVQSTFGSPCTPMSGGVNLGFNSVSSATAPVVKNFTVQDITNPLWFYCAQTSPASHCKAGMVFAVNPTATNTFALFQANAEASGTGTSTSSSAGSASTSAPAAGGAGPYGGSSTTTGTSGAAQIVSCSTLALMLMALAVGVAL